MPQRNHRAHVSVCFRGVVPHVQELLLVVSGRILCRKRQRHHSRESTAAEYIHELQKFTLAHGQVAAPEPHLESVHDDGGHHPPTQTDPTNDSLSGIRRCVRHLRHAAPESPTVRQGRRPLGRHRGSIYERRDALSSVPVALFLDTCYFRLLHYPPQYHWAVSRFYRRKKMGNKMVRVMLKVPVNLQRLVLSYLVPRQPWVVAFPNSGSCYWASAPASELVHYGRMYFLENYCDRTENPTPIH